jgi:hypothetical protein
MVIHYRERSEQTTNIRWMGKKMEKATQKENYDHQLKQILRCNLGYGKN